MHPKLEAVFKQRAQQQPRLVEAAHVGGIRRLGRDVVML
jgi:hypothetical protein